MGGSGLRHSHSSTPAMQLLASMGADQGWASHHKMAALNAMVMAALYLARRLT